MPIRTFLGRDEELVSISKAFDDQHSQEILQNIVVLWGMGGIGKTQLALMYASQQAQKYRATFWINARSEESILLGYSQLAQTLVDWAAELRGSALNFTRIGYELGIGQAVSPTTGEVSLPAPGNRVVVDAMKTWLRRTANKGWLWSLIQLMTWKTLTCSTLFQAEILEMCSLRHVALRHHS
jgi:Cdc6-like AAA superfamily ATPase